MSLKLHGVHHSARPTWKLRETIEFYRDKMGLSLVHAVSAKGWGPADHPDFLHFFFDSGQGSTIAFFYYIGTEQPGQLVHRPEYDHDATHTSWRVKSREELMAWRKRLESHDVEFLYQIEHEVIESIYFRDPNGYYLEIACPLRDFVPLDAGDAEQTLQAAMALEDRDALDDVSAVWRAKGRALQGEEELGVRIFVADIPEFGPILTAARSLPDCRVDPGPDGYSCISAGQEIHLNRKVMGLPPALWYSLLSGGYIGRIERYERNELVVVADSP